MRLLNNGVTVRLTTSPYNLLRESHFHLTKPSVITINGFYGRPHQLLRLQYGIWKQNRFNVLPYFYYPRAFTLEEHANDLAQVLQRHKSHSEVNATHFLTHSYGALVLRKAFQKLDWEGQKSRIVMIAPPNRGSYLARKLYQCYLGTSTLGRKSGKELGEWEPDYIDSFAGDMPKNCETLVIAGTRGWNPILSGVDAHDGRVLLSETRLRTPHYFETVPASHCFLLYHPRTIESAIEFLVGSSRPWEHPQRDHANRSTKYDSAQGMEEWKQYVETECIDTFETRSVLGANQSWRQFGLPPPEVTVADSHREHAVL